MKTLVFTLFLLLLSSCRESYQFPKGNNVIFITLDGVRYQEFFNKEIFSRFWEHHAQSGVVLGDPSKKSKVRIANVMSLSLPAYITMHTGKRTFCKTNNCGHIKKESLSEKVRRKLLLPYEKVAVFSSWNAICRGALREKSLVLNSCGQADVPFSEHEDINLESKKNPPVWDNARLDKYTWQHGFRFIKNNRPNLITLSMNDSDEYGHDKQWTNYINSLKSYDKRIHELFLLLDTMPEYKENTMVFITTDHGRGKKRWWGHTLMRQARPIWMFLTGPGIPKKGSISHKKKITHLHIKPFIEGFLGIYED